MTNCKKPTSKREQKQQYNFNLPARIRQKIAFIAEQEERSKADVMRSFLQNGIYSWEEQHGEIEL